MKIEQNKTSTADAGELYETFSGVLSSAKLGVSPVVSEQNPARLALFVWNAVSGDAIELVRSPTGGVAWAPASRKW